MRIIFLVAIIFNFTVCGCSKKDNSESPESYGFPQIESIHAKFLFSKEEHAVEPSVGGTAFFEFIGKNLLKE
jgi:hypothetical protein